LLIADAGDGRGRPVALRSFSDRTNHAEQENRHQRPASEAHTTFYD
jgi:hypothetical protein